MNILLLITGVSSGISHSIYSAVSKSLLKNRIREPFLFFLYISVLQAVVTLVLWLFVKPVIPPLAGRIPLLTAGLTGVIAYIFLYLALSDGDASSVMPIMGSKVIFSGFLAIFLLGEKHSWSIYLAALLVAISVGILSYSPSAGSKSKFSIRPIVLILLCSIVFAYTDINISRSLRYIDSYNFLVYYNSIIGLCSLVVIPYIKKKKVAFILEGKDVWWTFVSAVALVAATLLLVVSIKIANGVVIPNILMSTRGVFIVLISALLSHYGSDLLETQARKIYLLRLMASTLIILSIWLALR